MNKTHARFCRHVNSCGPVLSRRSSCMSRGKRDRCPRRTCLRRCLCLSLPLTHRHCEGKGFRLGVPCGGVTALRVKDWGPRAGSFLVVPQQCLGNASAPGVRAQDRRRLDLIVYGATMRDALRRSAVLRRRACRPAR